MVKDGAREPSGHFCRFFFFFFFFFFALQFAVQVGDVEVGFHCYVAPDAPYCLSRLAVEEAGMGDVREVSKGNTVTPLSNHGE
jgi:hypothetical protein